MGKDRWKALGRLQKAVKKITFLLNFNINRWKIASLIGGPSSKKKLSFNDRPGLMAFIEDSGLNDEPVYGGRGLQRTISYPSDQEDVDKRADAFIENFYKQLKMERQISLDLRYNRGNSFDSSKSP